MPITDLCADESALAPVARLLMEGFRDVGNDAWPDMASARREVEASLRPERISRVARAEDGAVVGWIAGASAYGGHVWELHPLVVHPQYRRQGIGRALVQDLEYHVRQRGAITLLLGTDDEQGRTSLGGVDLYPDILGHLARIANLRQHPYGFYQKLGFQIVGVVPDANGPGKPDILMAKRL